MVATDYGTLYFALAQIWNLPYGEEIVGTITAIDTFLGVILEISTNEYRKQIKKAEDEIEELRRLNGQDNQETDTL